MIKKLIDAVIECFEDENKSRKYYGHKLIEIPFFISVLEQSINNNKYKELHKDLKELDWHLEFIDEENCDGDIKIQIVFEKIDIFYSYIISFGYENRHWNYCQCSEGDVDYDARYDCCGHGCDWSAPEFSITKEIYLGKSSFNGDEHDYWVYKDKYYGITEKDKKEEERLFKIKMLEEEKARIEKELSELEKL